MSPKRFVAIHSPEPGLPGLVTVVVRMRGWLALIPGGATLTFVTVDRAVNAVILRKLLNAAIVGAEDILVLALVVIVVLSIPFGARAGAHIEIDFLQSRMSAGFATWSMALVTCAGLVLLTITSWRARWPCAWCIVVALKR